jgi:hypothetical protein
MEQPFFSPVQAPVVLGDAVGTKTTTYEVGQKVKYKLFDKHAKEHWFDGVIHGLKRYEDASGIITKVTYLVDTGRDERVDKHPFNPRDREVDKRINKILRDPNDKRGLDKLDEIVEDVLGQKNLPANSLEFDVVRQPEQLELTEDFLAPRK